MTIDLKDIKLGVRVEVRPMYGKDYKPGFVQGWNHNRHGGFDNPRHEYSVHVQCDDGTTHEVSNDDALAGRRIRYAAPKYSLNSDVEIRVYGYHREPFQRDGREIVEWRKGRVAGYAPETMFYTILTEGAAIHCVPESDLRPHTPPEDKVKELEKKVLELTAKNITLKSDLDHRDVQIKVHKEQIQRLKKIVRDFNSHLTYELAKEWR